MNYKVLYNPVLLINEMILFGDTLLNMSDKVKLFSNKINLKKSYSIQSEVFAMFFFFNSPLRVDLAYSCLKIGN